MIDLGAFLLDADDRSLTLHRKRVNEKGEPTTVVVGFYPNAHAVARKLASLPGHDAIAAGLTVAQIRDAIDTAAAVILEALEPALAAPATVHPDQGQLPC